MKALVRRPSPKLADGIVTHIERTRLDIGLADKQWEAYVDAMWSNGWENIEVAPAPDCLEGCVTFLSVRLRGLGD